MNSPFWRLNLVSIGAAAIALASLFLPWWGFSLPQGLGRSASWYLWNPPRFNARIAGASILYWNFAISSISVLVLALVSTALVVVGSLTLIRRYLIAGLVLSALTPIVYTVAIDNVTRNYCVTLLCFEGPVGSISVPVFGTNGITVAWGFQTGFYLFLVAALLMIAGLAFNRTLTRGTFATSAVMAPRTAISAAVSCTQCGTGLQEMTKFCPNCGHATV